MQLKSPFSFRGTLSRQAYALHLGVRTLLYTGAAYAFAPLFNMWNVSRGCTTDLSCMPTILPMAFSIRNVLALLFLASIIDILVRRIRAVGLSPWWAAAVTVLFLGNLVHLANPFPGFSEFGRMWQVRVGSPVSMVVAMALTVALAFLPSATFDRRAGGIKRVVRFGAGATTMTMIALSGLTTSVEFLVRNGLFPEGMAIYRTGFWALAVGILHLLAPVAVLAVLALVASENSGNTPAARRKAA